MQLILGSHRENAARSKGRNPGSAAHSCWGSTLCAQEPLRCSLGSRHTASAPRSSNFQLLRQHAASHLLAFAQNVPSGFFSPSPPNLHSPPFTWPMCTISTSPPPGRLGQSPLSRCSYRTPSRLIPLCDSHLLVCVAHKHENP